MIGDGDVEAIFENGDFDTEAVFHRAGDDTVTCQGWFTDRTEQVNVLTNEVESVQPTFEAATSVVGGGAVKRSDTVTINSTTYTVERVQDIGTGVSTVHLKT